MNFRSLLASVLLFLFHLSVEAKIYGPKRYDAIGLLTYVSSDLYYTTENFDSNSKAAGLTSSNSYLLMDIPFGIRYGLLPTLAFEAELKASYAMSKSSDPIFGGERTNSEIHEVRFSTDMLIETSGFDLIPELEIIFPFKKIDANTDSVMIGEGVQIITGKLHLQTEFGGADFFSYFGYQKRDNGLSDLVPWSLGMGWNSNGSLLGARLFGFQSISDDSDTNSSFIRESLNNKVNGGSLKFYGVNPSIVSTELLWFIKLQRQWQIQFNAGLDLAGQSYSKGIFAGVTLILDWGEKQRILRQRPRQEQRTQQPQGSGVAIDPETIDFREDTDDSKDQYYFKAPPPPKPLTRPPPRPQSKPRTRVSPSDQQIKDQMDDVEMQIELKRKKK